MKTIAHLICFLVILAFAASVLVLCGCEAQNPLRNDNLASDDQTTASKVVHVKELARSVENGNRSYTGDVITIRAKTENVHGDFITLQATDKVDVWVSFDDEFVDSNDYEQGREYTFQVYVWEIEHYVVNKRESWKVRCRLVF